MGKEIINQVQEAQRVPGSINPRRNTPRHIIIKLIKIKDRYNIKRNREKRQITYKDSHQVISRFLKRNCTSQKGMA